MCRLTSPKLQPVELRAAVYRSLAMCADAASACATSGFATTGSAMCACSTPGRALTATVMSARIPPIATATKTTCDCATSSTPKTRCDSAACRNSNSNRSLACAAYRFCCGSIDSLRHFDCVRCCLPFRFLPANMIAYFPDLNLIYTEIRLRCDILSTICYAVVANAAKTALSEPRTHRVQSRSCSRRRCALRRRFGKAAACRKRGRLTMRARNGSPCISYDGRSSREGT